MADSLIITSDQFSSNVEDQQFHIPSSESTITLSRRELIDFYDLERCFKCIRKFATKLPGNDGRTRTRVALQFPDKQLCHSAMVAQIIEENVNCKAYILADTSYGSCCVDEIAAEHIEADLIIHFGPTCLSRTERTPVLFVFGKEEIDIDCCCRSFRDCFQDKNTRILLIYDVVYHHAVDEIHSNLSSEYQSLVLAGVQCSNDVILKNNCSAAKNGDVEVDETIFHKLSLNGVERKRVSVCRFGRKFDLEDGCSFEDYIVFYIGKESLTLTNHMMTFNKCQFYSYDPEKSICRKEALNVNRLLMKRYYLIEKAKDAQIIGILIGTLGSANYLQILSRIKTILRNCGKKFYTFVVGKINPEKLANFMEIDMFVLIACPENTLINSQEFYKPIVTPFEIEIACTKAREWTGDYITDFQELLPGAVNHVQIEAKDTEIDFVPEISLISGQLRPVHTEKGENYTTSDILVARNQNTALSVNHATAAEFLSKRTWKGLEIKSGETPVTKAVEGRSGIASSYTHETGHNSNAFVD